MIKCELDALLQIPGHVTSQRNVIGRCLSSRQKHIRGGFFHLFCVKTVKHLQFSGLGRLEGGWNCGET